jgi:hypothetical protein
VVEFDLGLLELYATPERLRLDTRTRVHSITGLRLLGRITEGGRILSVRKSELGRHEDENRG